MRAEDDLKRDVRLAWYAAAFERQKKLPDLRVLLQDRQRQTHAQQEMALQAISARYGLAMHRTRLIRREVQPHG